MRPDQMPKEEPVKEPKLETLFNSARFIQELRNNNFSSSRQLKLLMRKHKVSETVVQYLREAGMLERTKMPFRGTSYYRVKYSVRNQNIKTLDSSLPLDIAYDAYVWANEKYFKNY